MHALILSALLCNPVDTGAIVQWDISALAEADGHASIRLVATTKPGWHIYATELENDLGPIPTSIVFTPSDAYALDGELVEPEPVAVFDPNFEMNVRYHDGSPVFIQRIHSLSDRPYTVQGEVVFMACNDHTCIPPEVVPFSLGIPAAEPKQ